MSLYFDKKCQPITQNNWCALWEDLSYRRIKEDWIGPYRISTVWLGINHQFWPDAPPLIFETMIFRDNDKRDELDLEMQRYTYEYEAIKGHEEMVKKCIDILGEANV